ncbi:putative inner dynein arm light chain, axonemal [Phlebotomus argentipes]|uniref:putative inner dynein arm light chain, axonemal n=1 Tax=Phlebotomus argentipes TaxID=94469 RepID=UPI0028930E2F|nr:putative inner dynein arm light chain, axonemal [Phlebotomus argentipes]
MAEGGTESLPTGNTLVKYNNPVLVVTHAEKRPATAGPMGSPTSAELSPRSKSSPGAVAESRKEAEEILNSVLPPRCWEEDGQMWMQTVSSTPATRQDVINLQEMLDTRLQQTQARETGICPVRRELYMQCFDELIRQVTINCTERGLLLLRVRDEIAMSMEAYETLYCSSVAFGMRKALQAQEGKESLQSLVTVLQAEKKVLENTISDMKIKADQVERRNAELRASEEKKHAEEIAFLKKTSAQLKAQLEGIIAPKK